MVNSAGFDSQCTVDGNEVQSAINKLKAGKDDGDVGLSSDFFYSCM